MAGVNTGTIWWDAWTAEMRAGSEFSKAWATATALSLDIDVVDIDKATVTVTGVADNDRADEDEVKNRPADKLLKVERGWDILKTNSERKRHWAPQPLEQIQTT